ncbi:MAG: DUF4407 domain-containing protein [Bacteroidetes bacterium]|nr:DUF4407 domain-containing protein [Bacteroidota bacterium]
MLKFFTKITGDDYNMLLNDTPSSRKKVVLFANILFVPVLLWFFSAYALATRIFGTSQLGGLFIGIMAASFIFLIERAILMSNGNRWIAAFRIVMGLCIASIGSIVVDEAIFHSDIERQLHINKETYIQTEKAKIQREYNAKLLTLQSVREEKGKAWQVALQEVSKESDGSGGSKLRGSGEIAKLKKELANDQLGDYQQARNDFTMLQEEMQIKLEKLEEKVNASYNGSMLLNRIKAMFDLVIAEKTMLFTYIIFTLLIWCIEFLVVLMKLNHVETNYERKLQLIEQIGEKRMSKIGNKDNNWV